MLVGIGHTFSRMRSSTGVAEVEAILVAVREKTRRGRKPEREARGSIEGEAVVPVEDKAGRRDIMLGSSNY